MVERLYNDKVLEHFQNPRNIGVIEDADVIGTARSLECGDVVRIYLKIKKDIIIDVKVKIFGCAFAIASASVLSEMAKGKTIDEASSIKNEDISEALGGLPLQKTHCSVLVESVLRDAIYQYRTSHNSG